MPPAAPLRSRFLKESTLRRLHYYPTALEAVLYARDLLPNTPRLVEVAARAGMTPVSFSRFFKDKVGITFSALLKRLRIERAIEQLETHYCSIELLACDNGYASGCAFTRAFREVVGETPSEYRRRLLN